MERYSRTHFEYLLGQHPIFGQVSPSALAVLLESVRISAVSRHSLVFSAGDASEGLYLVLEGEVKTYLATAAGGERLTALAGLGSVFGEEAAILGQAQPVSAQTTRDCVLAVIPSATLLRASAHCPAFNASLLGLLASKLYRVVTTELQATQRTSLQRVAHYLTQLAAQRSGSCDIELATDKQTLAAQLNLSPETLSRALTRLTRQGAIRPRGRRGVTVTDRERLQEYAEQA